jgi:DNA repair protein RecN (Recombination protein N)
MLTGLHVSNYILIDSLDITFPEGLIIITGETGAGKSILLGALSLVLGAKADASQIGPHADHCTVEASFDIREDEALRRILRENDLPDEDGMLVLRRVVARSGRSRCFAGDEPVSVGVLQELSARLVDIHSQHQTLQLSNEHFRLEALDLLAGCKELRTRCAAAWSRWQEARRSLETLRQERSALLQERDYNAARWEKLQEARLREGEVEELEAEQRQLAHAEEIKETLCAAEALLDESESSGPSLSQRLREAEKLLDKAARFVPSLVPLVQRMESARVELDDIGAELDSVNNATEVSPERLAQVEDRLSVLYGLLKKHGAGSVQELMAERDRLESLLQEADNLDQREQELEKAAAQAEEAYTGLSGELHRQREQAAGPFAEAIRQQLQELELDHAVFQIALEAATPGASGQDNVLFLFSSSGQRPTDVAKSASGGELSRIMLSLKALMARHTQMPTLVFDEIDTGVSGSAADKMGSLVCRMGAHMQVFAITHLPQVAAKGQAHYLVSKNQDVTSIRLLDREGRVHEIARMLSGATVTEAAVANAKSLLM